MSVFGKVRRTYILFLVTNGGKKGCFWGVFGVFLGCFWGVLLPLFTNKSDEVFYVTVLTNNFDEKTAYFWVFLG